MFIPRRTVPKRRRCGSSLAGILSTRFYSGGYGGFGGGGQEFDARQEIGVGSGVVDGGEDVVGVRSDDGEDDTIKAAIFTSPNSSMENQFEYDTNIAYQYDLSDEDGELSDCESGICSTDDGDRIGEIVEDDIVRLHEDDPAFRMVNLSFVSRLGELRDVTTVVDVLRKNWLSSFGQSRLRCFEMFAKLLPRWRKEFAWYGGSKQEIARIMSHGF